MSPPATLTRKGVKSVPQGLPYGLHFAYNGAFIKIDPEVLASCLWSDGRCWTADIDWAQRITERLAAKITGKA